MKTDKKEGQEPSDKPDPRTPKRKYRIIFNCAESRVVTIPPEFAEFAVGCMVKVTSPEEGKILIDLKE